MKVQTAGKTIHEFGIHFESKILLISIVGFFLAFSGIAAWKLWSFGYNALDLGIYRQVFEESLRGRLFNFTIHPHSFLGDHMELFLAALMPIYVLVKSPLTLVMLQIAALSMTAWPLAKLSAQIVGKPWHLLIVLAWLLNPAIQNMTLFEFHGLVFAVPLLLFAALAYQQKKFPTFMAVSALALTVREDVALVLIGFGILALVDRRRWIWSVLPIVLGVTWLIMATTIAGHLNPSSGYKFFFYYHWLGSGTAEIISAALTRPWLIIQHLLRGQNFSFLLTMLLPVLFLPLIRLRWLIPAGLVLLQILLLPTTGPLVMQTHYAALVLPFLLLATAEGFRWWQKKGPVFVMDLVFGLTVVYAAITLGPLLPAIQDIAQSGQRADQAHLAQTIVEQAPTDDLVASYAFLPALGNRPHLYSLHYVFLGRKQFSDEAYVLPENVETIVLDLQDFLLYQFTTVKDSDGYSRLRQLIQNRNFGVTTYIDRFVILQKDAGDVSPLLETTNYPAVEQSDGDLQQIRVTSAVRQTVSAGANNPFPLTVFDLTFQKIKPSKTIYQVELLWKHRGALVAHRLFPLGGGLWPTSDWIVGQQITSHFRVLEPKYLSGATLSARLVKLSGTNGLDRLGRQIPIYSNVVPVGSEIPLIPSR